jgi:hypothetical protein
MIRGSRSQFFRVAPFVASLFGFFFLTVGRQMTAAYAATPAASPSVVESPGGSSGGTSSGRAPTFALGFSDIRDLMQEVSEVNDAKFLLPLMATIGIGLMGAIGWGAVYYLRKEIVEARRDIDQENDRKLETLEQRLEARFKQVDAQLNSKDASVRYGLAVFLWRNGDFGNAANQATIALDDVDRVINAVEELNSSAPRPIRDLQADKEYRCHVIGDLAYYLAEAYQAANRRNADDARRAVELARRLRREWAVFENGPPLNLADNYLYVLATVRTIASEDMNQGKALWLNFRNPLAEHLRAESPDLAEQHLRLFAEFYGNEGRAEENK